MDYVNLGGAGVKVSPIALGLGLRGQSSPDEAQRLIEHALERGINLIDCANVYAMLDNTTNVGEAETVLGRVLRSKRDDVVITSKATSPVGAGPNDRGSSRYHIMREVERSLRRLQTDHIDVYLLHGFDEETPLEETIRALDDLVRAGKVRYVGCCNFRAWQVCKSLWVADQLNATPFMCVQNPYNLLNRGLEAGMFGLVRDQGLGVMAYSPLAGGLLSGVYSPDEQPPADSLWGMRPRRDLASALAERAGDVLAAVRETAGSIGKTPAQVALAWVLSHPEVTVAITGGDTIAHLDDNFGASARQSFKNPYLRDPNRDTSHAG